MKILITLLLLTLTTSHTIAGEIDPIQDLKEYDVEIIIFEDAHARYLSSQSWNQAIPHTGVNNTSENSVIENIGKETNENPVSFQQIKPSILNKIYKQVSTSSEYTVLFYGAWRQPGLDKELAFEIDIKDLKNIHMSKSTNTLTGKFKLVLARYLHIYNELEYQRHMLTTENTPEMTKVNDETYPLKSHRRMRSKELHYIDHPLVGMLIQINPVEKTEEEKL